MVTWDKPDEQVDWSEVAGAPGCSVIGCRRAASSRISLGPDRVEIYCGEHLCGVGMVIAATALGASSKSAMRLAVGLLAGVEVSDV